MSSPAQQSVAEMQVSSRVNDAINATPYQDMVLSVPDTWNLFLGGGRGGGKSYAALLLMLRHVEQYGERARVLFIREQHKGSAESEEQFDTLLGYAYESVRHNRGERVFRLPNGAHIEFGQLEAPGDYKKYQGRNLTLLVVDEFGALKDARWVMLLRSNLRAPEGVPLRTVLIANPGGALHTYCHANFVARAPAWSPFELDGEKWVYAPSTYLDNPHLVHDDYARKLHAACGHDEALLKAWLSGDWNIAKGAFFGADLDQRVHMLDDSWLKTRPPGWHSFVAMDFGMSAPSVAYFCVQPREHIGHIAARSLILLDELATAHPSDLNRGLGWPPGKLAEAIVEKCSSLGVHRGGVCDDYKGLDSTLIEEFRRLGLHFRRPEKSRISGWARMRELLHNAREQNGRPGLYISSRCKYFWSTLPFLPRDELRPEDCDTSAPDHAADAARYAVLESQKQVGSGFTIGHY